MYKYLGIVESVLINHAEMKKKNLEKFKKRLKSVLNTELNAKNIMLAIGEYVVPVISYTFGIIHWTEEDIKGIDIQVRKLLNMYRMFQIKSDVDRLYIPRVMGGRGLMSLWDSFKCTVIRLAHYLTNETDTQIKKCTEYDQAALFSITKKAKKFTLSHEFSPPSDLENKPLLRQAQLVAQKFKEKILLDRKNSFVSKPQHGVFFRQMTENDANTKDSLAWLGKCHMSPQSESYICGMQELAIFTRWHEMHLLKKIDNDKCRVCKKEAETTFHILAGCDTLAKKEYLDRHNCVAKYLHHQICSAYNIHTAKKWHEHNPPEVIMNTNVELIWDMLLTTDRNVGANRPDIVIRDKRKNKVFIIDVSCPSDVNVEKKENEKLSKYSALRVELGKMWKSECVVIPIVVGGLGTVSTNLNEYLKMIPGGPSVIMCVKLTLLGSEKIMRSVLSRK